jgi:hypothetical protein
MRAGSPPTAAMATATWRGSGLAAGARSAPTTASKAGQVQGVEQGDRQVGQLVGADHQLRAGAAAASPTPRPRRGRARSPGRCGQIDGDEALDQERGGLGVQRRAGGGEAALQQGPGAAADHQAHLVEGQGRQAFLGQDGVQRADQVRRGVDQGSVEVEGDRRAVQGVKVGMDLAFRLNGG